MKLKIKSKMRPVYKYKYYRELNDSQEERLEDLRERKARINEQMRKIKGPYYRHRA